jgi:hypothetical protein
MAETHDKTVLECLPREVRICIRNGAIACVADDYWDLTYHITAAVKAYCNIGPGIDQSKKDEAKLVNDLANFMAIAFTMAKVGIQPQHRPTPQAVRDAFYGLPSEVQGRLRTERKIAETDMLVKLTEDLA